MTEGRLKTIARIIKQAIDLAVQGKWRDAVAVNKSLIEDHAVSDVDTFNRLGRAYLEVGELEPARQAYTRALDLDKCNIIARKNLDRLQKLEVAAVGVTGMPARFEPGGFLEETGKAGVVTLLHPGEDCVLAALVPGDRVQLKAESKKLQVRNNLGELIGLVEPKHASRLLRLMAGGNRYSAFLISNDGILTVMIRELYQDPSQAGHVSFPPRRVDNLLRALNESASRRGGVPGEDDDAYPELEREEETDTEAYAYPRENRNIMVY